MRTARIPTDGGGERTTRESSWSPPFQLLLLFSWIEAKRRLEPVQLPTWISRWLVTSIYPGMVALFELLRTIWRQLRIWIQMFHGDNGFAVGINHHASTEQKT